MYEATALPTSKQPISKATNTISSLRDFTTSPPVPRCRHTYLGNTGYYRRIIRLLRRIHRGRRLPDLCPADRRFHTLVQGRETGGVAEKEERSLRFIASQLHLAQCECRRRVFRVEAELAQQGFFP